MCGDELWRRHGRDVNSCDIRSHEHYGIKKIKDLSTRYPRDKLLYFHSKGVTRRASSEDWVSYMEHFCRADIPWRRVAAAPQRGYPVETSRGDAAAVTWISRGRVAAAPQRGHPVETSRGDAAAVTWISRGDESRTPRL